MMQEEYTPEIVSVIDEDGKEHVFEELDRIETDEGRYVALVPLYDDPQQQMEDDGELIILEVLEEDGETVLAPIEDEEVFMQIGQMFEERLSDLYDFAEDGEE